MSVSALLRRQVLRRALFKYRKPVQAFLISAPFILLAPGLASAAGEDNEWQYWINYEKRPYPGQFVPLKTVPPMPERKHGVHVDHDHGHHEPAGYESAPKRKKYRKHHYSRPDHKEDYERYDRDYASHDDDADRHNDDHHDGGRGFGRLFPIAAEEHRNEGRHSSFRALHALGRSMVEKGPDDDPAGNSEMPSGYTFLGQFIDHDITFETETDLGREIEGDAELVNGRTPDLDLDSVYGGGPKRTPHLYRLPYIRVGRQISEEGEPVRYDLFRTRSSYHEGPGGGRATALVGDPRNDENIIISQLHAAFIAFHNRTADILVERDYGHARDEYCYGSRHCSTYDLALALPEQVRAEIFETARDHVIYYYHRVILDDFLPRLIGPHHVANLLKYKRDFFFPDGFRKENSELADLYIPLEFSFAFRYGHSQVRESYVLRDGESFDLLSDGRDSSPRAFEPVRPRHLVDWRYFFKVDAERPHGFNFARRIDPELVASLHRLNFSRVVGPDETGSLAARNLARGKVLRIPSGQAVAKLVLPRLEDRGLFARGRYGDREGYDGALWRAFLLPQDERTEYYLGEAKTPLWYYIIQEAGIFGTPTHLRALPPYEAGGDHYGARDGYDRPIRYASLNGPHSGDERYDDDRYYGGGHRLGPVGAAIVGEVLMGLMEHYVAKTGKGLDYDPEIKGSRSDLVVGGKHSRPKKRYLMRNFLIDSGVAEKYE